MDLKLLKGFHESILLEGQMGEWINSEHLPAIEAQYPQIYRAFIGHKKNNNQKSLSALLTALERELKVSVTDSDILVTTVDRTLPRTGILNGNPHPLVFILDNIRSAFNIGSVLRLANAINAEEVVLCGYTAGVDHPAVKKASLGAEFSIPISESLKIEDCISKLKTLSYKIIALETAQPSVELFKWQAPKGPTAIWVGNERFGIDQEKLKLADAILSIPMFGTKKSLNVAQALSVASYDWLRQFKS